MSLYDTKTVRSKKHETNCKYFARRGVLAVSLYTVFTCYLCGQTSYHYCGKIFMDENETYYTACLSGATAVVSAILGMCTDTKLSEFMFARYTLGITDSRAWLSFKPMTALLCIFAAVVYVALCLISCRMHRRAILGLKNKYYALNNPGERRK